MTVRLVHVGVRESLARRYLPGEDPPDWVGNDEDEGNFALLGWGENQTMALLTAAMTGDQHSVRVTIAALYEFAGSSKCAGGSCSATTR